VNFKGNYLFFSKAISDIIHVIFPTHCAACSRILLKKELLICVNCRHELPVITNQKNIQLTNNHFFKHKKHISSINVLFRYEKNSNVQQLIHNFKYKNPKKLGQTLAYWQIDSIKKELFMDEIDLVVPVPMHSKKLKSRGYNQINYYAKIIAHELNAKFLPKVLVKTKETKTQSKQSREERFLNIHESIKLNPKINIENLHILLIDDVITTGATIQACAESLNESSGIKISLVAIAITLFEDL